MKKNTIVWTLFFICHLGLALILSWHTLTKVDFAYPIAYEAFDINSHILHYAPQNRHKSDFEATTPSQHKAFFSRISYAINNDGAGLEQIKYTDSHGKATQLLHHDEVVHLLDVAKLIAFFNTLAVVLLIVQIAIIVLIKLKKYRLPNIQSIALGHLIGLIALTGAVVLVGPTTVFYTLHEWIFPPDHPWFFYYQDSLMTTLMKAPDIFAFIAALLVILASVFWGLFLLGYRSIFNMRTKNNHKA